MKQTTIFDKRRCGVEVADILRRYIQDYQKHYKLHPDHYKIVYDILNCRTEYLGGHIERCDCCGAERPAYNSCRNRHCPKCQTMTKERWLEARKAELLPVKYFHNIFTLPHELNPIILCNKRVMLGILFRSVSETLIAFGKNPQNGLGGVIGFITFLHTWDQLLNAHFHLHCLVPAGVLSLDGTQWIDCKYNYLFPEAALSKKFRGKFIAYFQEAYEKKELNFPGQTFKHGTLQGFKNLKNKLWSKKWVVDIEDPIDRPEWVLEYVGRYTHRVAISNDRIISLKNGEVCFRYKNRDKHTIETAKISAVEFIRRFLLHTLPKGFMRIRHYGLFANRYKKDRIQKCRMLLGLSAALPMVVEKTVQEMMLALTGSDINKCPICKKGTMQRILKIPEGTGLSGYHYIRCSE